MHVKKSNNGMIAMEKEEVRINIWPSTCMVGTYLLHPQQGKTQLYRGRNTYEELEQIFKNPRTHTSKGYKTKPYKKTGNDILLASRNAIEKNEPNKNSEWVKKAIQSCIVWSQSSLNSDDCLLKYNNNNKHTIKGHLEKHKKDKHVKESSDAKQISHYNKVEQNYLNVEVQLSELVKECKNELNNNDSSSNSSNTKPPDRVKHSIFKKRFTPEYLKSLHYILMEGVTPKPIGKIRTNNVCVGRQGFTPPEHVENALKEYCNSVLYILNNRYDMSMYGIAGFAMFHLVDLHPFADGNGRLSRYGEYVLTNMWSAIYC